MVFRRRSICLSLLMSALPFGAACAATESFERAVPGMFQTLDTAIGRWHAAPEHAEVHVGHAHEGRQSMRLLGGDRSVTLEFHAPLPAPVRFSCWAERWTARPPFRFRIEAAAADGPFREQADGDAVAVGGFRTKLESILPAGTARLRFHGMSPVGGGVMIDSIEMVDEQPMRLSRAEVVQPVMPVFLRQPTNPVVGINLHTEGGLEPLELEEIACSVSGSPPSTRIAEAAVVRGSAAGEPFAGQVGPSSVPGEDGRVRITGRAPLAAGDNWFWISVRLVDDADGNGRIDAAVTTVVVSGRKIDVDAGDPPGAQRVGVAVRRRGDDGSKIYRIPGLVRTNAGSLLAVYDVRRRGSTDLPADIDVGSSRSTDGGRTWEAMRIAIDMGADPAFAWDGVGDPCVFVDRKTGRIFVAALWSHGNRGWNGSGPGLSPDATGQLVITTSDDDGRSWSPPRNITSQVKDPDWRLLLAGPGTGITLSDGTLVFPAQFRAGDGTPSSTLIWSKDRGETWAVGRGVKPKTTESQLVQLGDGSIMINCRDDRGGSRTVAVTDDLGKSWRPHETDRQALPESICMASLLRIDIPNTGPRLFFSNPATVHGRHSMTIKVSVDEGRSWPAPAHTLYDSRPGFGYSCLAPIDAEHVGVLYEGRGDLFFLRFSRAELEAGFRDRKLEGTGIGRVRDAGR